MTEATAQSRLEQLLDRLLSVAEVAYSAGEFDAARSTAEEVRAVDPDNERAAQILERVRAKQRAPRGERALMTLLFSDLVDSTALSESPPLIAGARQPTGSPCINRGYRPGRCSR